MMRQGSLSIWLIALIAALAVGGAWLWLGNSDAVDEIEADSVGVVEASAREGVEVDAKQAPIRTERPNLKSTLVRGRVVDGDGEPVSFDLVRIAEHYGADDYSSKKSPQQGVAGEGSFEYSLKDLSNSNRWFLENGFPDKAYVLKGLRFTAEISDGRDARASIKLSAPDQVQVIQLGDIPLQADEPLVSGVILEQDGTPVPSLSVSISRTIYKGDKLQTFNVTNGRFITLTDRDGRFICYADGTQPGEYQLRIWGPAYEQYEQSFKPYQKDLKITLQPRPVIKGRVLVDEVIDPYQLTSHLSNGGIPYGDEGPSLYFIEPGVLGLSHMATSDLPFQLEIRTSPTSVLFQSQEYTLASGQVLMPPELNPIDLRGKLTAIHLTVKGSKQEPLSGRWTKVNGSDRSSESFSNGEAHIFSVGPIPKLMVSAKGNSPTVLSDVKSDASVILKPAIRARLQMPSDSVYFRGGRFRPALKPHYPDENVAFHLKTSDFDFDGFADVEFPGPGEYQIGLGFEPIKKSEQDRRGQTIAWRSYTVHSDNQLIQLQIDADELAKIK
jgi:hypothetical protein